MRNKSASHPVSTVAFMMAATLIAKALGMLRGILTASHYGTGMVAQALSEASHIPLTFFDFAFGAAILGCFIPVYNSFKEDTAEADEFARVFLNLVLLVTAALALLGILFAGPIIAFMAPGLDSGTKHLAEELLRIMFPMVIFTGSAYTLVGVMQSKGRYLLPAFVSAVSNAGVIVYLLFFDRMLGENGIYGLAAAYIVSWLVQLLTLAIPLAASGFKFIPKTTSGFFGCPALKRVVKMAPPIMLGSWLSPAGVLAGLYFASYISVTGAVTVFDYANAVYVIIAGTLTYSICNYAFPLLSRLGNDGGSEWSRVVRSGIISSAAIIIPFTIAVYILAGEGVTALYMRGKFGVQDVRETVYTLRCIVIGMPSFAVVEVVNRVFYSKGKVYIPMTAALCGIGVNIAASAMLIQIEPLRVGAVGLGCAAGQTAAAAVLLIFLIRRTDVINKNFIINLFQLAAAALFAGAVMITLYNFIGNDPYTAGLIRNLIIAVCVVSAGGIVYFALMKMMRITFGNRETQDWI